MATKRKQTPWLTEEKEFCDSDYECVQSGLDGTLENSADSCGSTYFFDGMLLQIIYKM